MRGLREIAASNLKIDYVRRYVCKKYMMPPTDPRYLAMTPEQLWLEYLEDALETDADKLNRMLDPNYSETVVQHVTGVEDIDAVEAANARGDTAEVERLLADWEQPAAGTSSTAPEAEVIFEETF